MDQGLRKGRKPTIVDGYGIILGGYSLSVALCEKLNRFNAESNFPTKSQGTSDIYITFAGFVDIYNKLADNLNV